MSESQLESAVASLQMGDYVSLAAMIAIAYDYVLTIPDEIEHVWKNRWTWVTLLFFIIRYVGLFAGLSLSIIGTSFLAGPPHTCLAMNDLENWAFSIFICAVDFVMILRVYALYGQSRLILVALILIYIPGAALMLLTCIRYAFPRNQTTAIVQVASYSVCVVVYPTYNWQTPSVPLQIGLAGLLSLLAIFQLAKQSFQMYRMTKEWKSNEYLFLFASEGSLYFLAILLYSIYSCLTRYNVVPPDNWSSAALFLVSTVPMIALAPRFIINIRILYSKRQITSFTGIDTGFGLTMRTDHRPQAIQGLGNIVFVEGISGDED